MKTPSEVRSWIDRAERVVVLTGAGISTDSGIPDFRGPQGLWTRNPVAEKMSNIHYYLADPEVRRASWQNRLTSPAMLVAGVMAPTFSSSRLHLTVMPLVTSE